MKIARAMPFKTAFAGVKSMRGHATATNTAAKAASMIGSAATGERSTPAYWFAASTISM